MNQPDSTADFPSNYIGRGFLCNRCLRHHLEGTPCPGFSPKQSNVIVSDKKEMVDHPAHYQTDEGMECIDAVEAALGPEGFQAFCRGNIIKYSWRSGKKGDAIEDLKKAKWYAVKAEESVRKQIDKEGEKFFKTGIHNFEDKFPS